MPGDGDWVEFMQFGERKPIRREQIGRRPESPEPSTREPTTSAFWYAVGLVRERRGLKGTEPLPPGVYLVDDGDPARVIAVDDAGGYWFGFDAACPPSSEWAGTPRGPSEEPSGAG